MLVVDLFLFARHNVSTAVHELICAVYIILSLRVP